MHLLYALRADVLQYLGEPVSSPFEPFALCYWAAGLWALQSLLREARTRRSHRS